MPPRRAPVRERAPSIPPKHGVQVQGLGDADAGPAHAGEAVSRLLEFAFRFLGSVQGCTPSRGLVVFGLGNL